ncbi:MAG: hypothetical protein AB7F19_03090 [Candidatus Babeliales bacterium]
MIFFKKLYISLSCVILLTSINYITAKVLIFTFVYNRPDFIELQQKLFKKFLKDDYEFVIFDDSKTTEITKKIKLVCQTYNITHIKIPQKLHDRPYLNRYRTPKWFAQYNNASSRNCNVVQYALDTLGFEHDDLVILLESDVFLIKEFSFYDYMQGYDLAGYDRSPEYSDNRQSLEFLWIGLIYLNMATLTNKYSFNINCGQIHGVNIDSGGYSHFYLHHINDARIKLFEKIRIEQLICMECTHAKNYRCSHNTKLLKALGFDMPTIAFIQDVPIDWGSGHSRKGLSKRNIEFLQNNSFVHFSGSSGYAMFSPYCNMEELYKDKAAAFTKYITYLLDA